MTLAAGTRLGPYEIVSPLGKGGMGEVYRARDTKLDRDVAIKVLPDELAADKERVARFEREAKLLASLNHPNIAAIYGFEGSPQPERSAERSVVAEREVLGVGPHDTRRCALVLELVEGPTLAERIERGPVPVDETIAIAKQIAEALEAGHEAGVIHRDLKPANVKVKEDGRVKVLDYGLAKAFEGDAPGSADAELSQSPTITRQGTQVGVILGTAAYMSPEQAKGKRVDKRTDIWSFGVVLYEMLTGTKAFSGDDVSETLAAVLRAEPDWDALPAGLPLTLRRFLIRCVERDPKQRVRDIGDLGLAMDGAFDPESGSSAPHARPHPKLAWVVAAAAATLAALLAVWSTRGPEPRHVSWFAHELSAEHRFDGDPRLQRLAVSPDGRHFAFRTSSGLYLRSLGERDVRLLVPTESSGGLFFSPDGRSVAYGDGGQLKRISLDGGAPVVVGPIPMFLMWSGVWTAEDTIYFSGPRRVDIHGDIFRVPARGGTPEVAVPAAAGESLEMPRLLPDGETLLITVRSARDLGSSVVAISLTTGDRTVVVEAGADARYLASGHLLYASDDELMAVAFDLQALRVTGGAVSMVQGLDRYRVGSANFAMSDDGALFFLEGDSAAERLAWVDRSGVVEVIETIPPDRYRHPRLSPDGASVLVVAQGDARIFEISSGRESRLTADGSTLYVGWTPDGDGITYTSSRSGRGEIWTQPADGSGDALQLTSLGGRVDFDEWAPDGRTIAAHHHVEEGTTNVLMIAVDGDVVKPERWLERDHEEDTPVFSPDGRYVAYLSEETGEREVYVRPFPGPGAQTPVSVGGGIEPAWAPSGELFYRRPRDYMMMAVEVETAPVLKLGAPLELFAGSGEGFSPTARYSVTADGQRFLMSTARTSGAVAAGQRPRVVIVQNWIEELKARVPN